MSLVRSILAFVLGAVALGFIFCGGDARAADVVAGPAPVRLPAPFAFLMEPSVLVAVGTFVLGFGTNAAKHWLRARKRRQVVAAELELELAKATPGMDDDLRAELRLRLARADEAALREVIDGVDSDRLAAILRQTFAAR